MGMLSYASAAINSRLNSVKINLKSVSQQKLYNLSMYRVYMVKLYDNGYISDPTTFNKEEFYANILELGISKMQDFNGVISLESRFALYAYDYYSTIDDAGSERLEFLKMLYNALRYREYCRSIDNLYEALGFSTKHLDRIKNTIKFNFNGNSMRANHEKSVSRASLGCLVKSGYKVEELSYLDLMFAKCCEMLDIPSKEIESGGLFSKGMSYELEVQHSELVLNGYVIPDGKYADRLMSWLKKHRWASESSSKGMLEYILWADTEFATNALKQTLSELENIGRSDDLVGVSKFTLYLKSKINYYNIPYSTFKIAIDEDEEYIFPEYTSFDGYTGECRQASTVEEEGIPCVGCPFPLHTDSETVSYFYDIEELIPDNDNAISTWFSHENRKKRNIDIVFSDSDIMPISSRKLYGELENKLYLGYLNSLKGELVLKVSSDEADLDTINIIKSRLIKKLGGEENDFKD